MPKSDSDDHFFPSFPSTPMKEQDQLQQQQRNLIFKQIYTFLFLLLNQTSLDLLSCWYIINIMQSGNKIQADLIEIPSQKTTLLFDLQSSTGVGKKTIQELHKSIGYITFAVNDQIIYLGTGILISENLVLTATSSIYDFRFGQFHKDCMFCLPGSIGDIGSFWKTLRAIFPENKSGQGQSNFALLQLQKKMPIKNILPLNINFNLQEKAQKQEMFLIGYPIKLKLVLNDTHKLSQWRVIEKNEVSQVNIQTSADKNSIYEGLRGSPIFFRGSNGIMSVIGFHNGVVRGKQNGKECCLNQGRMMTKELYQRIKEEEKILQMEPLNLKLANQFMNKGNELTDQNKFQEALIYLKKGAEIYPRGVQIHYNIGLVLYKIERFEEALESYKRVVALNPNYTSAHHNMGVIYLINLKKYEEAVICCKKALELDPKKVSSYYTLARSLEKLGKFQEAVKNYKIVVSLDKSDAEAWFNMAESLRLMGRYEESVKSYKEYISVAPRKSRVLAYENMGVCYIHLKQQEKALECMRRALELNQNMQEAHNNMANMLVSMNRLDEALPYFKKVIEINPRDAQVHINMGNAFLKLNRIQEAWNCYSKAVEIEPTCTQGYISKGTIQFLIGQFQVAAESFKNALKVDQENRGDAGCYSDADGEIRRSSINLQKGWLGQRGSETPIDDVNLNIMIVKQMANMNCNSRLNLRRDFWGDQLE